MKMPFGKYKGVKIENIPSDYLEWILENVTLRDTLQDEINAQISLKDGKGVIRQKGKFDA